MQRLIWLSFFIGIICSSVAEARNTTQHTIYQRGVASWYGSEAGRFTANGEHFNPQAMTCAHRYLPIGTFVRITNLANNLSIVLRVNDRGPYHAPRIIDLSWGAATKLGYVRQGLAEVQVEVLP